MGNYIPIYQWIDKKTGKAVDVIRSFKDYENPPTQEEAPDFQDPEWERSIGDNTTVIKGNGWGMGKGSWIALLGGYLCLHILNYLA